MFICLQIFRYMIPDIKRKSSSDTVLAVRINALAKEIGTDLLTNCRRTNSVISYTANLRTQLNQSHSIMQGAQHFLSATERVLLIPKRSHRNTTSSRCYFIPYSDIKREVMERICASKIDIL